MLDLALALVLPALLLFAVAWAAAQVRRHGWRRVVRRVFSRPGDRARAAAGQVLRTTYRICLRDAERQRRSDGTAGGGWCGAFFPGQRTAQQARCSVLHVTHMLSAAVCAEMQVRRHGW